MERHHENAAEDVAAAVEDLRELLDRHAGSPDVAAAVLTSEQSIFHGIATS